VVNRSEKLLKLWRADDPAAVILALDHSALSATHDAKVGSLVARASHLKNLVAQRLEELSHEFFESLGSQAGELSELELGALGLMPELLDAIATFLNGLSDRLERFLDTRALGGLETKGVPVALEQCVVDCVIQAGSFAPGQLILKAPEDCKLEMLDRAGKLCTCTDGRSVLLVRGREEQQTLP
jgi:hypothetical protein